MHKLILAIVLGMLAACTLTEQPGSVNSGLNPIFPDPEKKALATVIKVAPKAKLPIYIVPKSVTSLSDGKQVAPAAHWKIAKGQLLSESLRQWCSVAGYSLHWAVPEVVVGADVDLETNFEHAVQAVIEAANDGMKPGGTQLPPGEKNTPMMAYFYLSNTPKILRIAAQ